MKLRLFSGLALCLASLSALAAPPTVPSTEQIEAIVHDYLLKNPGVLRDAFIVLQRQEAAAAQARASAAIEALGKELLADPESPVAGNPNGDVTIVEFFDYHCGYCKRAAPVLKEVLATDAKVRVVYKQLPILGPDSITAARAALAAGKQGKYQSMHDALFASEALDEATIFRLAAQQGLDVERLRRDMAAPAINEELEKNVAMAAPLGITGTPGFVIGKDVAPGVLDLDGMRRMIAAARRVTPQ